MKSRLFMSVNIENLLLEIQSCLTKFDKKQNKELKLIKNMVVQIESKVQLIAEKIQEFEIILDAADFIEDNIYQKDYDDEPDWGDYGTYDDEEDEEEGW